jgi:hypothetical protein
VDCSAGGKISPRLTGARTAVIVKGNCVENLIIQFDDISITTDGVTPASITAADASQATVLVDGARRILIDGGAATISIRGGVFGLSATRGAAVDIKNCVATNNSNTGLIVGSASSLTVDNCQVSANGNGVFAVNTSSLVVTNGTVSGNTGVGIGVLRNSYVRVGQDAGGTATVRPVTISGNGSNGIVVSEASAATIVGGVIEASGSTNLFVGRASSAQIGVGSNNLQAGVTVQNGARDGIFVEGGYATIVLSTISGNALRGVAVSNAGAARIGILNDSSTYRGNLITANGASGVHVSWSGSAYIGGNTIRGNGTSTSTNLGRFGVNVHHASATLVGGNVIDNNAETGVFASAAHVFIGDAGFGLPTSNVISTNGIGVSPTNTGGIFAFENAVIRVNDAQISNNNGPAAQAFESGVIELRGVSTASASGAGNPPGALIQFGSSLRVRDSASIVSADSDGIQASNLAAINIRDGNIVQGGGSAFGVSCLLSSPAALPAVTLTGNLANVTGPGGSSNGCNLFP